MHASWRALSRQAAIPRAADREAATGMTAGKAAVLAIFGCVASALYMTAAPALGLGGPTLIERPKDLPVRNAGSEMKNERSMWKAMNRHVKEEVRTPPP